MGPVDLRSRPEPGYHLPVSIRVGALFAVLLSGCATDDQAGRAGRTVAIGWQVVEEADATARTGEGEGVPEARAAVLAARERFHRAQGVVRIWQDTGTGELGWYTLVPCLGAALERLRASFEDADLPLPRDLDQAREMTRVADSRRCAEARRP